MTMELTIDQALQQAIEAHGAGRLHQAEQLYRAILQAQPGHPHANHNLGVLAVSVGQSAVALPLLKTALERDPAQGQFWLSYADALINSAQLETARQILDQARARGLTGAAVEAVERRLPPPDDTPLASAVRHREAGEYGQARAVLAAWLDGEPQDAEAWSLLAQVCLLDRCEAEAQQAVERALALAPDLPSVRRNQSRLLLRAQRPEQALHAAQSADEASPEDPETWLVRAACLLAVGSDAQAGSLIERALQARPGWAEALGARASIRIRQGDQAGARADLEMAVSAKPHLVSLWSMLASIRRQSGDMAAAVAALERVHAFDTDNASILVDLGEMLRQSEQTDRAIALLERAVSLAPMNGGAWVSLGAALLQAERTEEAAAALARAVDLDPHSAEALNNLGALARTSQDWTAALDYFQRALAIQPKNGVFTLNIGAALMELSRSNEAEAVFRRMVASEPGNRDAHVSLGLLLSRGGSMEQASQCYRLALSCAPDDPESLLPAADHAMFRDDLDEAIALYGRTMEVDPHGRGLKAGVNLAVLHYAQGSYELSRGLLDASRHVLTNPAESLRPYRVYWKYLHDLLVSRQGRESSAAAAAKDFEALYVIGESHALSSHDLPVEAGGVSLIGRCRWISGCKQWHLGGPGRNWHKHKFEAVVAALPARAALLLAIGEIDCRHDEGILAFGLTRPEIPRDRIVESTVCSYLDYVVTATTPFGHRVSVQGVPCPDIRTRNLSQIEIKNWAEVVAACNAALEAGCRSRGFGYVDVGSMTDRGDGISNETWHMDGVHLRPQGMQEAWRRHYRPGAARHRP